MDEPTLFLHVEDSDIRGKLQIMSSTERFRLIESNQQDWISQLDQLRCNVAVIEADQFDVDALNKLSDSQLVDSVNFIFVSQGEPNPHLDRVMQLSASYHYRKPLRFELLEETLRDILQQLTDSCEHYVTTLQSDLNQFGLLLGSSPVMRKLYRTIRKVAPTEANVLVCGESGSGKELVSQTIHLASPRKGKPFIAINCGTLSPELAESELFGHCKGAFTGAHRDHAGVFEQAAGGTLFLDEITEMSLEHQVKLLRVLESSEYRPVGGSTTRQADVRVIAATNRDPLQAIADEELREDLYFRLAHFPIQVPALRERGDDVIGLATHFLAYRNAQEKQHKNISPEAIELIAKYPWPGNVRELKHAVERAYVLADHWLGPEHFNLNGHCATSRLSIPAGVKLETLEREAIINTLLENNGNKTDSADQLGISVKTLYNKLDKYQRESGTK